MILNHVVYNDKNNTVDIRSITTFFNFYVQFFYLLNTIKIIPIPVCIYIYIGIIIIHNLWCIHQYMYLPKHFPHSLKKKTSRKRHCDELEFTTRLAKGTRHTFYLYTFCLLTSHRIPLSCSHVRGSGAPATRCSLVASD